MSAAGLPVPKLYGIIDPDLGFDNKGGSLRSLSEFKQLLSEYDFNSFVIKPIEGTQSKMTFIIKGKNESKQFVYIDIK